MRRMSESSQLENTPIDSACTRRVALKSGLVAAIAGGCAGVESTSLAQATADGSLAMPADQWWCWRGPRGDNTTAPDAQAPQQPDPSKVRWAVDVPGRGHSSPVVTDDAIYLTTGDKQQQIQAVLGFDRATGKPLFQTVVHRGGIPAKNHPKNTEASPTVAFDGRSLFASFYNSDAIQLTSLTTDGKIRWTKKIAPFDPQRYQFGYGASPLLYGNTVIVASEMDLGAWLVALDRQSGKEVWRTPRPKMITFSSPIVANVAGRDQLLISGANLVCSYDPSNGRMLWQTPATTAATCGTMVWNSTHVFASGGYPDSQTVCVAADGSGKVQWSNNQKCYEQSMLVVGNHLYGVTDAGVGHCWDVSDGRVIWRQRLGGKWSSSPVLVGDLIYAFNESGDGWVFESGRDRFVQRSQVRVADEVFSTPTVVGDTMYLRVANGSGQSRREKLLAMI